ncbi:MAG TPA: tRNA-dihydrouridine synthase family protein [Spirochaetia bacterium]|nr:tRNA-dihydrouridine synthase family protein [Spirochaetia bacterium]HRZ64265.1 tRNA-dihydrouridine synthase family protein [Spirochaetia bacterium]
MPPPFPPGSLFLAPMVALSHRPLRTLTREFGGLDYACTEMASAAALVSGSPYDEWYLDPEPCPERTILQFYTVKPERLVEALERCASLPVFGADINFGCSAPHIERAGGGVAWMADPSRAAELVRLARAAWPKPLSAKLRIGPEEDYTALRDFCLRLVGAGLDFLTLHPRLKSEKLRRSSRWDYVASLARELPIPVIGNGDVRSYADYRDKLEACRPAGIMIGREAVRRPWIFALIRGREADPAFELEVDLEATAYRMLELIEGQLPPDFHLTRARRFFFYYCDNFSFAHHIKWKTQNAPNLEAIRAELAAYFVEVPADRRKRQQS